MSTTLLSVINWPTSTMLLDMPLVTYKMVNQLIVAKDTCPHRGIPLRLGKNDGQGVVCRYDGLRLSSEGKCNRIPAHPQHKISNRFHLCTYAAVDKYGLIWCSLTTSKTLNRIFPSCHFGMMLNTSN